MGITITDDLEIPEAELELEFARSGGPGGQNVNKVETKVTLRFDVRTSPSLSESQRTLIEEQLGTRLTRTGVLRVTSQRHRTREANRHAALARLIELLADALEERPERRATRIPARERTRRLEDKRRRSQRKSLRGRIDSEP